MSTIPKKVAVTVVDEKGKVRDLMHGEASLVVVLSRDENGNADSIGVSTRGKMSDRDLMQMLLAALNHVQTSFDDEMADTNVTDMLVKLRRAEQRATKGIVSRGFGRA